MMKNIQDQTFNKQTLSLCPKKMPINAEIYVQEDWRFRTIKRACR